MARDTQAPPERSCPPGESAAGRRRAAWPGAAASSDRGPGHRQHSRSRRHCHDARSGDTTAGWLAGEETPGEPERRARQPAAGDRLARLPLSAGAGAGPGGKCHLPSRLGALDGCAARAGVGPTRGGMARAATAQRATVITARSPGGNPPAGHVRAGQAAAASATSRFRGGIGTRAGHTRHRVVHQPQPQGRP